MNMIELASRSVTLAARVRHSPPPILYHYTSADGVIGILSSKELWATNIEFLNDTNEILEAVRVARNIIENLIDRDTFSHGEKLLMNKMREHAGSAAKRFYVVSFSETSDSLLHWQAYCSGSGGYAIGFPSKHLSGLALEKSWYLAKCIYGHTEKYSVLTEVINSFLEEFRLLPIPEGQEGDLSKDLVWRFSQHLAQIGTVIKSDAFSAEAEWRLISPVVPDHDERLAFRSGIMGIVPYYRFPLLTELNPHLARCEDAQLVLRCGPTNERFQTQHAAQTILSRYLGGASYGGSDVPLRKS